MGLYPSATSLVRMPSASLISENGPNCTRNSLSFAAADATNAGYSFFLSASTSASASSCLLTAATCTKYPEVGMVVAGSAALLAGAVPPFAGAGAPDVLVFALAGG